MLARHDLVGEIVPGRTAQGRQAPRPEVEGMGCFFAPGHPHLGMAEKGDRGHGRAEQVLPVDVGLYALTRPIVVDYGLVYSPPESLDPLGEFS